MHNITRTHPFIFISGGCRSGKSAYAQTLAARLSPHRLYIATAFARDEEMQNRITLHQSSRGEGWRVLETSPASLHILPQQITTNVIPGDVLVLDCLTLWVAAYMELETNQEAIAAACAALLDTLWHLPHPVLIVSNEVGMGIVPESAAGRLFRDLAGNANQQAATKAEAAIFMVSGLPLFLKNNLSQSLFEF